MTDRLPVLVTRAAQALAAATTAAEVLDARDAAALAYDAAKAAARFAKAKGAHDELIAAAHRAQADALEIEASAKRRLADEYDAAQERGEVATQARGGANIADGVPERNTVATVTDLGLTRKQVHDARRLRDAEAASPGLVRNTLDARLKRGEEPTKAAVRQAVAEVIDISSRLTLLPTVEEIERGSLAEEQADEAAQSEDYDARNVEHRARAINGALNTFDFVSITGEEYWSIYGKSPKCETFIKWVRAAKKKIDDIVKAHDNMQR